MPQPRWVAKVKPEHRAQYPELRVEQWYDVVPLWPGLTQRMTNLSGERLTRVRIGRDYLTVRADHLEFRSARDEERDAAAVRGSGPAA
ncbi:MAG TPA: hypothetical protein VFS40_14420 [Gemmatimonadales bacterium]|nr:hypothetical protein [Gemmatimonadales bacterium]